MARTNPCPKLDKTTAYEPKLGTFVEAFRGRHWISARGSEFLRVTQLSCASTYRIGGPLTQATSDQRTPG